MVVSATAFYLLPWSPAYALVFVALAYLTWRRLDLALALVVLAAPLFMHPKHLGSAQFAPSELLILLDVTVAVAYGFRPSTEGRLRWRAVLASPFFWPACLLLAGATLSTVFAADRHLALRAYRERVLEPVAFFALLVAVRSTFTVKLLRLQALLGAGLLASVVGAGQWITGRGLAQTPGSSVRLVQSVYTSADNLGLLFDRVIPLWLGMALARARARVSVLWLALGLLFVVVLGLSRSRGAEAGVALGSLLVVVVLFGRGRRVRAALALLAVAGILVAGVAGAKVLTAVNAGHANTVQERLYLWHSAERMIADHPLFGVGPDNFLHYYAPSIHGSAPGKHGPGWFKYLYLYCPAGEGYLDPHDISTRQPCISHPHNEVLDFWLSTGVLGLAGFVWLQGTFWWLCLRRLGRIAGRNRFLLAGVMGAMLASVVHGMVDNSYFLPDLAVFFWLLCASAEWLTSDPNGISAVKGAGPGPGSPT